MKEEKNRLDALMLKCRNILKTEGIPISDKILGPVVNKRIRSRFGRCIKKMSQYEIEISSRLLDCTDSVIEEILIHELLHTCPGCMNHGRKWKGYAEKLNRSYGYCIQVRTSYEKLGLENPGSREPVKYRIVCTGCGQVIERRRKCRLVDHIDRYRCGKCGEKLEIQ